jgi:hypothetical protein
MKIPCKVLAAAVLAVSAGSFAAPAGAAPITAPTSLQNAAAPPVEAVQWRRDWRGWGPGLVAGAIVGGAIAAAQPWNYGYGGPYAAYAYDPGYAYAPAYDAYSYGSGYGAGPAYGAGPVYSYGPGAAYANSPGPSYSTGYASGPGAAYAYSPGPSYSTGPGGGDENYCRQRFRSYDPRSGTYLGYDGMRHPCP